MALGYKVKKGKKVIEVDNRQAGTVQRVFELKEQYSDWSLSQMALQLNQEGYQTKQGRSFTKVQVKRI